MSNSKNSQYYLVTTHTVVPAPTTKTGTIQTVGIHVLGTGTFFLAEIKNGDWIVDITNDECRYVTTRRDDTYLAIDSPFTSDFAPGTTLQVVRSRAKEISVANEGAAAGTVDGSAFEADSILTFSKAAKNPDGNDFIDPIFVDGTGTSIAVLITK